MSIVAKAAGEKVEARSVAIATKEGVVEVDVTKPSELLRSDSKDSMVFVQLKEGLVSQLYKMTIEIISNNDQVPGFAGVDVAKIKGYNIFIYLPKVEAVDLEAEVKNYERYVMEVLIKA
jgi:hypothetical protein